MTSTGSRGSVGMRPIYMRLDIHLKHMSHCMYMHYDMHLMGGTPATPTNRGRFMNDTTENTEGVPAHTRPLGFWLRAVDHLLTQEFAAAFEAEGVTRRDGMLLSVLDGDIDRPGVAERLARKGKRLSGLEERGWIARTDDGTWALTDDGRAAKQRLGGIVDGLRARVASAVPAEDYATTMASLEAIARELGWNEELRMPRHGRGRFGHRGFGPGFGRGFGPGAGFGPGFGRGFEPGFRPGHGFGPGCDHGEHPHGKHPHGEHPHGEHRHGGHRRKHDERAHERGFDAGFVRGRSAAEA